MPLRLLAVGCGTATKYSNRSDRTCSSTTLQVLAATAMTATDRSTSATDQKFPVPRPCQIQRGARGNAGLQRVTGPYPSKWGFRSSTPYSPHLAPKAVGLFVRLTRIEQATNEAATPGREEQDGLPERSCRRLPLPPPRGTTRHPLQLASCSLAPTLMRGTRQKPAPGQRAPEAARRS
jgi:hypothetical protein